METQAQACPLAAWIHRVEFNNRVVGHDKDLSNLMEKLRAKYHYLSTLALMDFIFFISSFKSF